jgi:hypothetical protein
LPPDEIPDNSVDGLALTVQMVAGDGVCRVQFVEKSGCDSLAVAIGTSHGAYKFSGSQGLRMDRLAEIQKAVPSHFPLVMHGSSSVPKEWVDRINNAGGCGAALKEYDHLLADDPDYAEAARRFVAKVQDITEFLADNLHNPPTGRLDLRVTYADSCHLRHVQHVVQQPRDLLHAIPGLTLVELAQPDACCGSAGVYNIVHPDTAGLVLDAKLDDIETTAADVIAITNTGCHMQLLYGARKAELGARVMHVVELLDLAYDDALPSNAR